jgi:hypothetical protein
MVRWAPVASSAGAKTRCSSYATESARVHTTNRRSEIVPKSGDDPVTRTGRRKTRHA